MPQPFTGKVDDPLIERNFRSLREQIKSLERRLREAGKVDDPPTLLVFGARDVHSTAVRYLTSAPMTANAVASASDASVIAPFDGELRSLSVRHPNVNGPGSAVRYTARINDSDTALTVELATGATGEVLLAGRAIRFNAGSALGVVADPLGDLAGDTAIQPIVTLEIVRTA
jgi:hypothetical protein